MSATMFRVTWPTREDAHAIVSAFDEAMDELVALEAEELVHTGEKPGGLCKGEPTGEPASSEDVAVLAHLAAHLEELADNLAASAAKVRKTATLAAYGWERE